LKSYGTISFKFRGYKAIEPKSVLWSKKGHTMEVSCGLNLVYCCTNNTYRWRDMQESAGTDAVFGMTFIFFRVSFRAK